MTLGKRSDLTQLTIWLWHLYETKYFIIIVEGQMEQWCWNQVTVTPWVGNMLEPPQGWLLQVENQEFGHWKPLKIRDLESCENSQGRDKTYAKMTLDIWHMWGGRTLLSMLGGKGNLSLVVMNTTSWVWGKERTIETEKHWLRRIFKLSLMDSWSC